ncbi:MAG: hypothetical protein Q8O30_11390 [Candidatus Omnitrophota bacterium]|nr:hypothetical protein [Candidatus Omnitrophota bacterium]
MSYNLAEEIHSSPSDELFNKFKSVSAKICEDSVISAAMLGYELNETDRDKIMSPEMKEMANKASVELMDRYKNAFIVPDVEAQKILSGKYNNSKNKQDILNSIKEFQKIAVKLPMPILYLIEKYNKNSLSELELEFAARLFKEFLKQTYNSISLSPK